MSIDISLEEAAKDLENLCNQIIETNEVVKISRSDGSHVVLIAETELESLLETLYLLRYPANSTRLFTALQRANAKITEPQSVSELYERLGLAEDDGSNCIEIAS